MKLKQLEIKGFKSFPDKTVLNFDVGITGIIGPNGCGKSNIIDSIRWVIGEQKMTNLRSENLESLVFNGSKTRNSSGLAEVTLTFENTKNLLPTEFSTVAVTRRFFKSGDSEYRLNDTPCRHKDIVNLFMDTGITNDSYSIIELAKVDDIIKDKENSRRKMIEQAAGITIYKERKKEAKSKLETTESDLVRIEDMLHQLNEQLAILEKEAKKTEKYLEIQQEYKKYSIELAKANLSTYHNKYHELNQKQTEHLDNKLAVDAEIAKESADIESQKVSNVEKEKLLKAEQFSFNAFVSDMQEKENQKKLLKQQIDFHKNTVEKTKKQVGFATEQLKSNIESASLGEKNLEEEATRLQQLQGTLEENKKALQVKRDLFDVTRKNIEGKRQAGQQLQEKVFETGKYITVADTNIGNLSNRLQQLSLDNTSKTKQQEEITQSLQSINQSIEQKKTELQDLEVQQQQTKENIFNTQSVLEKLRSNLAEEVRKRDAKKNEYELLKSLIDDMDGYPDSVKFLHQTSDWIKNVPTFSDIFYVKEGYRTAIENYLDTYLNHFVVKNYTEAIQAIQLLDKQQKGKANFIILATVPEHKQKSDLVVPNGLPALDVIEVDETYKQLIEYLLQDVYIVEDEMILLQHTTTGAVLLSKSGKIVKGKFTIYGGSAGKFEGKKIGRVRNLEILKAQMVETVQSVESIEKQIKQTQQDVLTQNGLLKDSLIRKIGQELVELNNKKIALQTKSEQITNQILQIQEETKNVNRKISEEQQTSSEKRTAYEDLKEKFQSQKLAIQEDEKYYIEVEKNYTEASRVLNDAEMATAKQQHKLKVVEQDLSFRKTQKETLEKQINANQQEIDASEKGLIEVHNRLDALEKALTELILSKDAKQKNLNLLEQEFDSHRQEIANKDIQLKSLTKKKDFLEQELAQIRNQLNDMKLELSGTKERLMIEFKVDVEDILDDDRETDLSLKELEVQVDKIVKRKNNLGEVSPMAIETYQESKKRYDIIVEHKTDLVNAKVSLLKTIDEVETTANQKFSETFEKVRTHFKQVFKSLFTQDDTADLELENDKNISDTRVEIIAKPKGKKPASISQLSGGEKTLTAIALLFSIYLIKPAPFCILDEVDAPLDDSNVSKFTNMIKEFSSSSQFILVTHNKSTMASVDVIYGVTMQELGVSKIVPVDFRTLK
ncbi:MAG: chromosome segregation protein SMC [Limnohabitans sp.]|nr:chromosome segregation protein SMC [Limnohabitans sp.]